MITNILGTFLVASTMVFSKPNKVLPIQIDQNAETLTLTADELNNNTYPKLTEYLQTENAFTEMENTTITYNNETYAFEDISRYDLEYLGTYTIHFAIADNENETANHWYIYEYISETDTTQEITFEHDITINNAPSNLLTIFKEYTMGGSIVGSITSGLGLISALTSEFLLGFNTMIWQNGALTNVGLFAFVMLGISVSFAIVKLILHLLRRNTGA